MGLMGSFIRFRVSEH